MALTEGKKIRPRGAFGAPNPDGWGPWIGVPEERQTVCAFKDCTDRGRPRVCHRDGRYHHHGCIHYDLSDPRMRDGWCWVCDDHYEQLVAEQDDKRKARTA